MMPPFDITPARGEMAGYTRMTVEGSRQIVAHGTGPQAEANVLDRWQQAMLIGRIEVAEGEGRDG